MIWLVFLLSFPTRLGGFSPSYKWSYIYTPTRLTGLTSKREGNCNAMATWSDSMSSGHVISIDLNSSFAFNQTFNQTVTSTSLLPPLSLLYRLGYNLLYISTSFFWSRSPTRLTEPRLSSLLDGRLARKDYLQISAFPIRWWWSERRSTMESHWKSHEWSGERDGWLDVARPNSWNVNISFYQASPMWWRPTSPVWWRPAFPVWWRSVFPV